MNNLSKRDLLWKINDNELSDLISLEHQSSKPDFFQRTDLPFMITLTNIKDGDPENSVFSIFTPEKQFHRHVTNVFFDRQKYLHQHNTFELTYVLSGNMYQIVEGKKYYYSAGSCCLTNRNTLHTEELNGDVSCIFLDFSLEFINLLTTYRKQMLFPLEQKQFDNQIFQFLLDNLSEQHDNIKDFLDFVPLINETEQKKLIHDLFEKMLYTLLFPYYGATYEIQTLFLQLLSILCNPSFYNITHVTSKKKMDDLLFRRIELILDESNGLIHNQELAKILNYNDSYLGRIVKKYTGLSLYEYRMTFTMKHAAELLRNTSHSIYTISEMLQFTNHRQFYKLFKKQYHITPGQFRQQRT